MGVSDSFLFTEIDEFAGVVRGTAKMATRMKFIFDDVPVQI